MKELLPSLSLPLNVCLFAVAAVAVWFAGSRIALYADDISRRTGLGQATIGVILLAGVTSLPELATSLTAAYSDSPKLAVNNLLGSIVMQVAVLALADQVFHRRALTSVVPNSVVMVQGALNICLLTWVAIAMTLGDVALLGAGVWSWSCLILAMVCFVLISREGERSAWIAKIEPKTIEESPEARPLEGSTEVDSESDNVEKQNKPITPLSNFQLGFATILVAGVILLAGSVVALTSEQIAEQTQLGDSFVGMVFVALTTSLPEVSTVFASMRRNLYTLAISDILGTNIINVALLTLVDLTAQGEPVFNLTGKFGLIATLLGLLVTGLYVYGLAERRDKTLSRMGVDSALVLVVYLGGLVILYQLR